MKRVFRKIGRWFKYNPPSAATFDEWTEFDESFKQNAPIRYVITKFFGKVQFKIEYIYKTVTMRIVSHFQKPHSIDTGLKVDPYGFVSVSDLMLHGNFSVIVNLIENKYSMSHIREYNIIGAKKIVKKKQKQLLGWKRFLPYRFRWNCKKNRRFARQYGLAYLTTTQTCNPDLKETIDELIELYIWWVDTRPARKRPSLSFSMDDFDIMEMMSGKWKKENPELYREWKDHLKECKKVEEEWSLEDNLMLCRLLSIRDEIPVV